MEWVILLVVIIYFYTGEIEIFGVLIGAVIALILKNAGLFS